jgi:SsrA-binding protein
MAKEQVPGRKVIARNRRATHDYFIDERFEAGLMLVGTEVKSLRDGRATINEAYAAEQNGEIFLINATISEYTGGNRFNHEPISCPTLLLWGDDDPFLTVNVGERARATLPNALLKVYAYTGHFVPEERPLESAEDIALRFTDTPLMSS